MVYSENYMKLLWICVLEMHYAIKLNVLLTPRTSVVFLNKINQGWVSCELWHIKTNLTSIEKSCATKLPEHSPRSYKGSTNINCGKVFGYCLVLTSCLFWSMFWSIHLNCNMGLNFTITNYAPKMARLMALPVCTLQAGTGAVWLTCIQSLWQNLPCQSYIEASLEVLVYVSVVQGHCQHN